MKEKGGDEWIHKIEGDYGNIGKPSVAQAICPPADNDRIRKCNGQPIENPGFFILPSHEEDSEPDKIAEQADKKINHGERNPAVEGNDLRTNGDNFTVPAELEFGPVSDTLLGQGELDILRIFDLDVINLDQFR